MNVLLITIFAIAYCLIAFEQLVKVNKAASALLGAVLSWTVYALYSSDQTLVNHQLSENLSEIASILFFLLGAMVIVELIDAHDGFELITTHIHQHNKVRLLWVLSLITFFFSAVLDNLTTTIVMATLLRKLIADEKDRVYFLGMLVLAANAGGVWSPIGDVTTTMLWVGGQVSSGGIMKALLLPAFVSMAVPLVWVSIKLKGNVSRPPSIQHRLSAAVSNSNQGVVLFTGLLVLVLVPVFKTFTHLPPYLGILGGVGVLWVVTEFMHDNKNESEKQQLSVVRALQKSDTPSILFFFGILLCIAALQSAQILGVASQWLTTHITSKAGIAVLFGGMSAVIDNVPLVAALQGMFSTEIWPLDHPFWHLLAYCTGVGGSLLIIGSAAGVAAMGAENITFGWYIKRITLLALLGYLSGAAVYLLLHPL